MATNAEIAKTLIKFLASNPQLITQFLDHPYSVTQKATGSTKKLSQKDMSQVVTAAAAMSTGRNVDLSNLASVAATLLSQNGGSVHTLTNSLFGTSAQAQALQQQQQAQLAAQQQAAAAQQQAAAAQQQAAPAIDLATLVSLAGALMSTANSAQAAQPVQPAQVRPTGADLVDFSDGFDVKDVIGLASIFLANK